MSMVLIRLPAISDRGVPGVDACSSISQDRNISSEHSIPQKLIKPE